MPRRRSPNDSVSGSSRSELIYTGRGDDTINANAGNDVIFAGSGDDTVNAGAGNDLVFGGSGNDKIHGGAGNDLVFGGSGNDEISGGEGNDRIFGGSGDDTIDGGNGNDLIFGGSGRDEIDGGSGNDRIFGGSGDDKVDGGEGNDLIFGGSGNDEISGGEGNDRIFGGSGDDQIDGGNGDDLIFGGSGDDTIDGGDGRDRVYAGSGNDALIYTLPDTGTSGSLRPDYYSGGSGFDTLRINLTAAQIDDADLVSELSDYLDAIDAGTTSYYVRLPSLNLAVSSIEAVQIYVDGVLTDIRDTGGIAAENDSFAVREDETLTDSVAGNDTAPAGATFTLVTPVTQGTFALNADGTFTYDPDGTYDNLAFGATATQEFTYQLSHGGQTATATASIAIIGTNDAPTVTAAVTASVSEDDTAVSIDLLQGSADVDDGSTLSVANLTGLVSGVTLSGTNLEVDTSNPSIQALAAGQTEEVTVSYDIVDEYGASVTQTATITITGTNDAPTVSGAVSAAATEDGAVQTISLLAGAADVDTGTTLSVNNVSTLPAGVTQSGADIIVDPSHADFQSLAAGEEAEITISYDIVDGDGGSVEQTATITITGTNDDPTVSAAITAGAQKDDTSFNVDLLQFATDIDAGTTFSVGNVTGLTDGVTLDGTNLAVDPSNPAFAGLASDESREITVTFDILDGDGGSVTQTATITITGSDSNLPPVVTGPVEADVSEDVSSGVEIDLLTGASDPDGTAPLTIQNVSTLPQGFTLSGTTLTVDPSDTAYQTLPAGQTREVEITYDIVDESGATVAQTATITIIGQNDEPEVAAALTGSVTEDGDNLVIELLDGTRDIDVGTTLSVADVSALPDGVTLSGTTLTVDPTHAAFQLLGTGETQDITVSYNVVDGDGGSVAQTATITVTGVNDNPEVEAEVTEFSAEDSGVFSVDLLTYSSDVDADGHLNVDNFSTLPDGVTVSGTFLIVNTSHASFQSLAAGTLLEFTVSYNVIDGDGGSVAQTATITIQGVNDAPVVSATITQSANEDDVAFDLDLLTNASDVDADTDLDVADVSTLPAGITLSGTTLTIDPTNAAFQSLPAGVTQDVTVTYNIVDGAGGSVAQTATITITGTNDAPTVSGAIISSATEDGDAVEIELLTNASDIDTGTTLDIANVSTLPAGFTLSGTTLTVDPSHAAFQSIPVGVTRDIAVTYDVVDGAGGTVAQTATITITGTNDAPVIDGALTESADEDGGQLEIDLLAFASDVDDGTELEVANLTGLVDGLTLSETGRLLIVNPADTSFQELAQGEEREIVVNYDIIDGDGGSVEQSITVTITGTNDTPTVEAALSATAVEDSDAFTVDLLTGAADIDSGAELTAQNVSALIPGVTLSDDGVVTVDPSHADFQSLNVGQAEVLTITYDVEDEHGASIAQTATITITGTNDTPTVDAALVVEADEDDAVLTVNLLEGASDVDDGSRLSVTDVTGMGPGFTLNGNSLEIDSSVAAYQPLAVGQVATYTVNYNVVDEHGASVTQSATITINGTNDTPVVTGTVDSQFTQSRVAYSMTLDTELFFDIDTTDTLTLSATLASGDPLPSWLTFDASTGTFSGTPDDQRQAELYRIEVTATDPHGASATTGFWMGQGDTHLRGTTDDSETVPGTSFNGDILFGGEGRDRLTGDSSNDLYVVTADNDLTVIHDDGFNNTDTLLLDDIDSADVTFDRRNPNSSDLVISVAGVALVLVLNTLDGSPYNQIESVAFGDGSVISIADIRAMLISQDQSAGADRVEGYDDPDTIEGGTGNDYLTAEDGSDTYIFNTGDGQDVIEDNGFYDTDVVRFVDRSSTEATYSHGPASDDSVLISFANGDSVLLRGGLDGDIYHGIEEVEFGDDDITVTIADIREILLNQQQTSGDDVVTGLGQDETFEAGLGNDFVSGGDGSDTYIFNSGDGQDVILDDGFGDTDSVIFTDYALADAAFERIPSSLNDISITFSNGDQVILRGSFDGRIYGSIEQVVFQGTDVDEILSMDDISAIVLNQDSTTGDDDLTAAGSSRSNTLEGGQGNDYMSGNDGSDTYIFGSGDGRDVINDIGYLDTDVLNLSDFATTDLTVRFEQGSTSNVVLTFATGEEITIIDQTSNDGRIESFTFSNGTLTAAEIETLATNGTAPGDVFTGDDLANTLSGDGGHDHLSGGQGGDTYVFDSGDERVEIDDNGNGISDEVVINGYSSTEAIFQRVEGRSDLRIILGGGDEIIIRDGLSNSYNDTIENFTFVGDGTTLSISDVFQILVDNQSSAGDDIINGFDSAQTLTGGTGDDFLSGGNGDDIYIFTAGDGNDEIRDNGAGGTDRIQINGHNFNATAITRVPGTENDVLLDFGSGDSILIRGALNGSYTDGIEEIRFFANGDSQTVTMQDLRGRLMSAQSSDGDDHVSGTRSTETLEGGLGDDFLTGGSNGDTYIYSLGDGNDVIRENGAGGGDVLQLNGISRDSVTVARAIDSPSTAILTLSDGSTIRLEDTLGNSFTNTVETIDFVDESATWNTQNLRDAIFSRESTSGDDDLIGWNSNDTLVGGTGNDYLTGQSGGDTYVFNVGDGNDIVDDLGGSGQDGLRFNGRDATDATFSLLYDGGTDLLIEFENGDSVVVRNTSTGSYTNRIEQYEFDDEILTHADMVALL